MKRTLWKLCILPALALLISLLEQKPAEAVAVTPSRTNDFAQAYAQLFAPAGEAATAETETKYLAYCCSAEYYCEVMTSGECWSLGGNAHPDEYLCYKWCR
jgi:hypothetical protein